MRKKMNTDQYMLRWLRLNNAFNDGFPRLS